MNLKLQKFYQKLFAFAKQDFKKKPLELESFMKFCLGHDFATAVDIWEFLILENDAALGNDAELARLLGETVLDLFAKKNERLTTKLLCENTSIRKAVFTYCPAACSGISFDILLDLLLSNKTVECEDIFKCMAKNTQSPPYGALMRDLIEKMLIELMKKATLAGKKIEMPKKTSTMLLSNIAKIKTSERALLEQRIKEIL